MKKVKQIACLLGLSIETVQKILKNVTGWQAIPVQNLILYCQSTLKEGR